MPLLPDVSYDLRSVWRLKTCKNGAICVTMDIETSIMNSVPDGHPFGQYEDDCVLGKDGDIIK